MRNKTQKTIKTFSVYKTSIQSYSTARAQSHTDIHRLHTYIHHNHIQTYIDSSGLFSHLQRVRTAVWSQRVSRHCPAECTVASHLSVCASPTGWSIVWAGRVVFAPPSSHPHCSCHAVARLSDLQHLCIRWNVSDLLKQVFGLLFEEKNQI